VAGEGGQEAASATSNNSAGRRIPQLPCSGISALAGESTYPCTHAAQQSDAFGRFRQEVDAPSWWNNSFLTGRDYRGARDGRKGGAAGRGGPSLTNRTVARAAQPGARAVTNNRTVARAAQPGARAVTNKPDGRKVRRSRARRAVTNKPDGRKAAQPARRAVTNKPDGRKGGAAGRGGPSLNKPAVARAAQPGRGGPSLTNRTVARAAQPGAAGRH